MFGVFDPQGPIASAQRDLIVTAVLLMLLVAIPLLVLLYTFIWKYRAGNKNAKYEPDRVGGVLGQLAWWLVPAALILVISVINWKSTHALDPYRPLDSSVKPLNVQVVALEWKWLFIYPEQHIATVNFLQFPAGTPVHFDLTADGPMSSFWIPQLGSQIYAMAAMTTQLNLMADKEGEFAGKNTEINGKGFAGMTFTAKSTSEEDFNSWVAAVQASANPLDVGSYNTLAEPSENNAPAYYSSVDESLYNTIVMKFMVPGTSSAQELPGIRTTPASDLQTAPGMQMTPGMHM